MNASTIIANAYNNMLIAQGSHSVALPAATISAHPEARAALGSKLVQLESVPVSDLLAAMDRYAANTDWRVYSRADWQAARDTLAQ